MGLTAYWRVLRRLPIGRARHVVPGLPGVRVLKPGEVIGVSSPDWDGFILALAGC